jgi:hypothetical protein
MNCKYANQHWWVDTLNLLKPNGDFHVSSGLTMKNLHSDHTVFYNLEKVSFLCGKNWIFKYNLC